MKTIPEHLKAKTKLICDALKSRDHFFIKPNYEIIDKGSTIQCSNVYAVIIDLLTKPVNTKDDGTQTRQKCWTFSSNKDSNDHAVVNSDSSSNEHLITCIFENITSE